MTHGKRYANPHKQLSVARLAASYIDSAVHCQVASRTFSNRLHGAAIHTWLYRHCPDEASLESKGHHKNQESDAQCLQVGGFCLMYKEDMKRVAPLWLKYSRAVRHDPDVSTLPLSCFCDSIHLT